MIADDHYGSRRHCMQAQILIYREIQKNQGTAIVLITRNLGVVAEMCDTVAVMYAGSVVEYATVQQLLQNPKHPYTIHLMNSLPKPGSQRLIPIEGQPPSLVNLPKGCRFAKSLLLGVDSCESSIPPLEEKSAGHDARCFLVEKEV